MSHVATEMMLCACAWILHHELAHIIAGDAGSDADGIDRERRADMAATEWVLGHAAAEPALTKRGVGIAAALVSITGYDLAFPRAASSRLTHPDASERINTCLSHVAFGADHVTHQVAVDTLRLFVERFQVPVPPGPFENPSEALREYCVALMRRPR